jgi:hypothetical protein
MLMWYCIYKQIHFDLFANHLKIIPLLMSIYEVIEFNIIELWLFNLHYFVWLKM